MPQRYTLLPASLYAKNRSKFTAEMHPKSIAVFNSNDIFQTAADSTLPFVQHTDFLYLTGVDQEESVLLLFPDARDPAMREVLFLKETNAHIAVWEGEKLSKQQAQEQTGITSVKWLDEFDSVFRKLMAEAEGIYLNQNEHYRAGVAQETREDRFIKQTLATYPLHEKYKSNRVLQRLRSIKEKEEIAQMQTACDITEKGFRRVLNFLRPGCMEYEVEAEFVHEFVRNASRGFAYTPIVASGNNANVLHYTENRNPCKAGDLLLLDVGAEYGNYCADMSRTIPVNGRFTDRQRAVYDAVLRVKDLAAKRLVPGNNWYTYHEEVGEMMTKELVDLNLLKLEEVKNAPKEKPAYKKYFMHGTSHHIGLDTHDYGLLTDSFAPNMVFTVEPGIYIPEEGFGIRLEDDYVVQEKGEPINLMKNIPIAAEEIEALMAQKS